MSNPFFNEPILNSPHFHARYAGNKVAIEIESLRILDGTLSPRALGLVIEWASQHYAEVTGSQLPQWTRQKESYSADMTHQQSS
jgi:hypothetical protein